MKKCCSSVKKHNTIRAWTQQEDDKLVDYIKINGKDCWCNLPKSVGLHRSRKSCKVRWITYLRSQVEQANFQQDEDDLIIRLHALLGNRWSLIAGRLPGRTENEVKSYWNSHLKIKLIQMGMDPNNHQVNVQTLLPVFDASFESNHHQTNISDATSSVRRKDSTKKEETVTSDSLDLATFPSKSKASKD